MLQVLSNLLTNAVKFTPEAGNITVKLSLINSALAEIQVSDTGIGISAEFLPHIFDRFAARSCLVILINDAPMSQIDLLICRNVLIYFDSDAQTSILNRFHFALNNAGFLFLGKSELLVHRRQIFTPIDLNHRVYAKALNLAPEEYSSINPRASKNQKIHTTPNSQSAFWRTAFETSPVAQLAIDRDSCLIEANEQATLLFDLTLSDWN